MKIYHVETQQAYDELMIELEEKGCTWISGEKLTDFDEFNTYGIDTYVYDECCKISASSGNYFKAHHSDELVIEYKAKGEEMTQEDMKQEKIKQNIFDLAKDVYVAVESFARGTLVVEADLKEAKTSAKKLIEKIEKIDKYLESLKPEFKVGDIVSSEIFINGSGIIRLEEDLINDFSIIKGLWYIKKDCEIKDTSFGVIKKKTRHATPEEITEYESALTFHKMGRKPFELKRGDVVYLKGYDKNIFLDSGNIYKKHNFIDGDVVLVKTVEEVNEWLENK